MNVLNIHAPEGQYGPISLTGVLSYLRAGYSLWQSESIQVTSAVVGTLGVAYALARSVQLAWNFCKPSSLPIYAHAEKGSWALVTGATDGIGRGFAEALLSHGFNVVLHGRNPEKLARVKAELSKEFPRRQLDTIVADASSLDVDFSIFSHKAANLPNGGKLTILINNVGGAPYSPVYVTHDDMPHKNIDTCIDINARFPTHLTRELLPLLKQNGPSLVLNCCSFVALQSPPFLATYVATKAFVEGLTHGVRADLTAAAILGDAAAGQVECFGVWIGNVLSSGNKTNVPLFTLTSRQCAEASLSRVGSGYPMVFPSWRVVAMLYSTLAMPTRLKDKFVAKQMHARLEEEKRKL